MGKPPEVPPEPKKELKEKKEGPSKNQEKEILSALRTLYDIWKEVYGDRHPHEKVPPLETKDYRFVMVNYGSDGGPSIEIYKKNPKKGEITRMTFQGLDPNAVKIWIDHRPETDQRMHSQIGEEIIGSVEPNEFGIDVQADNIAAVRQNLTKFSRILDQAYKTKKQLQDLEKETF